MRISGIPAGSEKPITVVVENGKIQDILDGVSSPDLGGATVGIAPGLIDIQINGYRGESFVSMDVNPDGIRRIIQDCWAAGTTHVCPTLFSNTAEVFEHSIRTLARTCDDNPDLAGSVIGFHIEGPYVSEEDGPRGSHRKDVIRDPDYDEFSAWRELSGDRIVNITVAPERAGMPAFIRQVTQDGVRVSLGHHAADTEQIEAAIEAGARCATHLANGSHAMLPRFTNYLFDQLADDRLYASFITDGQHIRKNALRVYFRSKPKDKIIIVSDAVSLGGLPAGVQKREDGVEVRVLENGRVEMNDDSGNLAGAGVLQDRCIPFAASVGVHDLKSVFEFCAINPARFLGVDDRLGSLTPGKSASLILYDPEISDRLNVTMTMVDGVVVYEK